MAYSQEIIENVRHSNDIVDVIGSYVPLKQRGSTYFGLCPFHNEGTPSFSVNPDKQLYYCFGCGAAGNVIGFVMQMENDSFPEALKRLADRAGIVLPEPELSPAAKKREKLRETLFKMHADAGRYYYAALKAEKGAVAREYIERRSMSSELCRKFGIGYAPAVQSSLSDYLVKKGYKERDIEKSGLVFKSNNGRFKDKFYGRLMFPIFDVQSRVIGFGGRILGRGEPKYLNSPETLIFSKSNNLYGLNFARQAHKREMILVEGYMDMFTIYQAGFHNVVASLGTAFNDKHASVLKRFADEVIILYDSDEAGERAALRAIDVLVKKGFEVKVLQVPNGKDPDEFIRVNGSGEFAKLLVNAVSHIKFRVDCEKRNYNLENTEHKIKFTTQAAKIISTLDNNVEREAYAEDIAAETGISREAILSDVKRMADRTEAEFMAEAEKKRIKMYSSNMDGEGSKGILSAQGIILSFALSDINIYRRLKEHLRPEDFEGDVYIRLCRLIYEKNEDGGGVLPAEIAAYFDTPESQQRVSRIFARETSYATVQDKEKALNESLKMIKRHSLDKRIASSGDVAELNRLIAEKRELEKLHISVSDG